MIYYINLSQHRFYDCYVSYFLFNVEPANAISFYNSHARRELSYIYEDHAMEWTIFCDKSLFIEYTSKNKSIKGKRIEIWANLTMKDFYRDNPIKGRRNFFNKEMFRKTSNDII